MYKVRLLFLALIFVSYSFFLEARTFGVSDALVNEFTGAPGETIEGTVRLCNYLDEPFKIKVASLDFPNKTNPDTLEDDVGLAPRTSAEWITVENAELTLSSKARYEYKFKIRIPNDPNLEGTYNSCLLFSPNQIDPRYRNSNQMIRVAIHYCSQILIHIKDTGHYSLKVLDKDVVYDKNFKALNYSVHVQNSGTLAIRPKAHLSLFNAQGMRILEESPYDRWVYPDKGSSYVMNITHLPPGKYRGVMVFDQKGSQYFATKVEFDITQGHRVQRYNVSANSYLKPEDRMKETIYGPSFLELLEARAKVQAEEIKDKEEGNFLKIFEDSIGRLFKFQKSTHSN